MSGNRHAPQNPGGGKFLSRRGIGRIEIMNLVSRAVPARLEL